MPNDSIEGSVILCCNQLVSTYAVIKMEDVLICLNSVVKFVHIRPFCTVTCTYMHVHANCREAVAALLILLLLHTPAC